MNAKGNGLHALINLLWGSVNASLNVSIWKMPLPYDMNTRSGWTQSVSICSKDVVRLNTYRWAWCRLVAISSQSSHEANMNSAMCSLASLMSAWSQTQAWLASWKNLFVILGCTQEVPLGRNHGLESLKVVKNWVYLTLALYVQTEGMNV